MLFFRKKSKPYHIEVCVPIVKKLTPNDYQQLCLRTAKTENTSDELINECALGLTGEAGEFADLLKKFLYQGHDKDAEHMAKELGDISWYVAVAAYALGYPLEEIMQMNIDKLKARYPDGFDEAKSVNRKVGDI